MLKLYRVSMLAALAAGLMTLSGSQAEDKKETKDKEEAKVEMPNSIATLIMAHNLAEFGRKTKSSEALATAALLLAKTPLHEPDAKEETPKEGEMKTSDHKAEIAELLAEAKQMDPKSKVVAEIAEKVAELQSEKSRSVSKTGPDGRPRLFQKPFKAGEKYTDKNYMFPNVAFDSANGVTFFVIGSLKDPIDFDIRDARTNQPMRVLNINQAEGRGIYAVTIRYAPRQSFNITYTNKGRAQLIQYYATDRGN